MEKVYHYVSIHNDIQGKRVPSPQIGQEPSNFVIYTDGVKVLADEAAENKNF